MKNPDYAAIIMAFIATVLVITGLGYWVYSLDQDYKESRPRPKWDNGTIVQSALSKQQGMIITLRCYGGANACYYDVRFAGLQSTTNTRLLSSDDAIENEPLMVVSSMREYELEDIK
jgi:hypothetical protein